MNKQTETAAKTLSDRQTSVLTGYPSLDKPWLKYFSKEAINTPLPRGKNLYDNLYDNNKDHLSDIALRFFGKAYTYGELFKMIDEAESKSKSIGIRKGDVVAFISVMTPDMIAVFYALNRIGAVSCMLDPRMPIEEMATNMELAKVSSLFVLDFFLKQAEELNSITSLSKVVVLSVSNNLKQPLKLMSFLRTHNKIRNRTWEKWSKIECAAEEYKTEAVDDKDEIPAVICYTGGTTGKSKGVLLSNYNVNSIIEQYRLATNGFERGQKWLTSAIPFVAYTLVCGLHCPLSFGLECYVEPYDVPKMIKKVLKHRINHVAANPAFYDLFYKQAKDIDLSFLIMPITGADKLNIKTYEKVNSLLKKQGCSWKLCNGYGMTEVGSAASVPISNSCNKPGSVGIPLIDTIITAFDVNDGNECKYNTSGEICISGPGVMLKYLGNDDYTREVIKEHDGRRWMHTGDIGHIDEDGCVFIEGRMKRMIIRYDGFKVFPTKVEDVLSKMDKVELCCCVAKDDETHDSGQLPVVFVVPKSGTDHSVIEVELERISNARLPEYSRPSKFYFVDSLPMTNANKVDYRELESIAKGKLLEKDNVIK